MKRRRKNISGAFFGLNEKTTMSWYGTSGYNAVLTTKEWSQAADGFSWSVQSQGGTIYKPNSPKIRMALNIQEKCSYILNPKKRVVSDMILFPN